MFVATIVVVFKFIVFLLVLALARGLCWLVNLLVIHPFLDPLQYLPGPEGKFFERQLSPVVDPSYSMDTYKEWTRLYGKTFKFSGLGKYDYRLMSFDIRVITHVLNSPAYEKPHRTRRVLNDIVGRGIFAMEGPEHQAQRTIVTPPFRAEAVKQFAPIFGLKARELRDIWDGKIEAGETRIEIMDWLLRAAYDSFGLAAYGYSFEALKNQQDEFYIAIRRVLEVAMQKNMLNFCFPIIDKIWPSEKVKEGQECMRTIHRVRKQLLAEKMKVVSITKSEEKGSATRRKFAAADKDLLSLLIETNADSTNKLSEADLLDQLSSFIFAGSDSTSISMTWILYFLSLYPDIQKRLRDEILEAGGDRDCESYDYTSLPYLNAIVQETLRLCPAFHGTVRQAVKDDVIPLSAGIPLRDGTIIHEVKIRKGSWVQIPIEGFNVSEELWGPDATQFNPDRWMDGRTHPHLGHANVMTFGLGNHSCPAWQFSIAEMKAFIATLLPSFVFKAIENQDVGKFNSILMRPFDRDERRAGRGLALPMIVERYLDV